MLAGRVVGTPKGLQRLVLIVYPAVAFAAEEAVLKAVLVGNVGAPAGLELGELVSVIRVGA